MTKKTNFGSQYPPQRDLTKTITDMEDKLDKLMLLNREMENNLNALKKRVDNHVDVRFEYCPHTTR